MNNLFINAIMTEDIFNTVRLQSFDGIDIDTVIIDNAFGNDISLIRNCYNIAFMETTFDAFDTNWKKAGSMFDQGIGTALIDDEIPMERLPETSHRFLE